MMDNIKLQNKLTRRVSGGSCQIDSSSWEFLNKEHDDREAKIVSEDSESASSSRSIQRSSSKDSVYQSEFDSTSTIDSTPDSLSNNHQDESIFSFQEELTFSDEVNMPNTSLSLFSCNTAIENCVKELAVSGDTFFGQSVRQFLVCTDESSLTDPRLVMRNMRQFMTGMKNYLLRTGEEKLKKVIEMERAKLSPNTFINIDSAIEEALQDAVIRPLEKKVLELLGTNESCEIATKSAMRNITNEDEITVVEGMVLSCEESYTKLENCSNTREKLYHYLSIVRNIITQLRAAGCCTVDVPTFCTSLCLTLARIGATTEIMWALTHRDTLGTEAGFYLALLYTSALSTIQDNQGGTPGNEKVDIFPILCF